MSKKELLGKFTHSTEISVGQKRSLTLQMIGVLRRSQERRIATMFDPQI